MVCSVCVCVCVEYVHVMPHTMGSEDNTGVGSLLHSVLLGYQAWWQVLSSRATSLPLSLFVVVILVFPFFNGFKGVNLSLTSFERHDEDYLFPVL